MANYSHLDFKRYGPQRAAEQANTIALVKNPVKADSYATFTGKVIASAPLALADWSFTASGQDLQVQIAAKSGITPSGTALATDDLSIAIYSSTGQIVYLVQDATDRAITNGAGDTVNIPQLTFFIREMTAV